MEPNLAEIETLVRDRICSVCTDRTAEGECGLPEPGRCALFRLLPEVARAIQSVTSDDIQPYIDSIRRHVCSVCTDQSASGECETRNAVQCALDAYLIPVVEAIEAATGKTFDRQSIGAGAPLQVSPGPALGTTLR